MLGASGWVTGRVGNLSHDLQSGFFLARFIPVPAGTNISLVNVGNGYSLD